MPHDLSQLENALNHFITQGQDRQAVIEQLHRLYVNIAQQTGDSVINAPQRICNDFYKLLSEIDWQNYSVEQLEVLDQDFSRGDPIQNLFARFLRSQLPQPEPKVKSGIAEANENPGRWWKKSFVQLLKERLSRNRLQSRGLLSEPNFSDLKSTISVSQLQSHLPKPPAFSAKKEEKNTSKGGFKRFSDIGYEDFNRPDSY